MARGARNQQPQARTRIGAFADWLLALGLLLIALPITFHNLGVQSLWLDEGVTQAYVTGQRLGTLLLDLLAPWQGYPLYYLVVKVTARALGDSEWALRLPSALAGGLAVPALYLLGTELRGRAVGLAAAALLLLAPWGLWQAQDAKPYSLALLAAIVLALLFARALRLGTRRAWLWWIIVALAAPFVHRLLLLSLLGCAACWALFQPRARRWPALFATAAAAMLVLGAIAGLLRYQRAGGQFRDVGPLHAARLTFEQFSVRQFAGDVPGLWFVPFGLLLLLGAFRCWFDLRRGGRSQESGVRGGKTKLPTPDAGRPAPGSRLPTPDPRHDRHARGAAVLLLVGGLPLALFLLLLLVQPFYETRYLVGVYPFWLLLLAWAVAPNTMASAMPNQNLVPRMSGRGAMTILPVLLGLVLLAWALVVEQRALFQPGRGIFSGAPVKEEYREAVRKLAQHVHPDDLVIVHPDSILPLYQYYARREARQPLPKPKTYSYLGRVETFTPRELDRDIRADLGSHQRAWLLIAPEHASVVDPPPTEADDVGWVGLAFQYGDSEGRIQCGQQPYAGFSGLRLYCNNMPDIKGQVPEPQVKREVIFGEQLRLRGYTLKPFPGGPRPGGTLPLSLFWEPLRSLAGTDYIVFLHLTLPDDPRPLAQTDGRPMEGGQPTSRWTKPHALLHDDRMIPLPEQLAPGRYVLRMGVYRAGDGTRLHAETLAPTLDDAVVLGEVQIVAP